MKATKVVKVPRFDITTTPPEDTVDDSDISAAGAAAIASTTTKSVDAHATTGGKHEVLTGLKSGHYGRRGIFWKRALDVASDLVIVRYLVADHVDYVVNKSVCLDKTVNE